MEFLVYGAPVELSRLTGTRVEDELVALTKDRKTELIGSYKTHDEDTGSPKCKSPFSANASTT